MWATSWTKCRTVCSLRTQSPCPASGRVWDEAGTFRVVYVAKFTDAVYVLHCFQKKTQQTAKRDIDLAQKRLKDLLKDIAS